MENRSLLIKKLGDKQKIKIKDRDRNGLLTYLKGKHQLRAILNMDVLDFDTDKIVKISEIIHK